MSKLCSVWPLKSGVSRARLQSMGNSAGFEPSLGHRTFADVLLWRHKNLTAGILVVVTLTAWVVFEKSGYTLVSLVSSVFLLLLTILFLWSKSAAIVNRPAPSLPHLHLSEELVNDAAAFIRDHINRAFFFSSQFRESMDGTRTRLIDMHFLVTKHWGLCITDFV